MPFPVSSRPWAGRCWRYVGFRQVRAWRPRPLPRYRVVDGLPKTPPACAVLDQADRIEDMLSQIDVLVYASGSEAVCERLPWHVEAIEYRHSPEPDSVNRLRPLLS
jgi:hypothetical protein